MVSKKKGRADLHGFFFSFLRSSFVASATKDATNEDGRAERPAEQLNTQLPQAKRAVSKIRTQLRAARKPLASL